MLADAEDAHSFSSLGGVGHPVVPVSLVRCLVMFTGVAGSSIRLLVNKIPFLLADGDGVGYGLIMDPTLREWFKDCRFMSLVVRALRLLSTLRCWSTPFATRDTPFKASSRSSSSSSGVSYLFAGCDDR